MAKKPDLVVYDEERQKYDAAIKPYGTNASAPAIQPLNTATWRNDGVDRVNKQFKSRFDELSKAYQELMHQFEYNDLVYNAKFNFEPIIGEVYHLYNNARYCLLCKCWWHCYGYRNTSQFCFDRLARK